MRHAILLSVTSLVLASSITSALTADFSFEIKTAAFYSGVLPADGRYALDKFMLTTTPVGIAPRKLNVIADFSTGPAAKPFATIVCSVGAVATGWTSAYEGKSCGLPDEISVPAGSPLFVTTSAAFAQVAFGDDASAFPAITENLRPYPGTNQTSCLAVGNRAKTPQPKGTGVRMVAYAMNDAVRGDDLATKICINATPFGSDAVGLVVSGSVYANKTQFVGSFACKAIDPPRVQKANSTFACAPKGNDNTPREPWTAPPGAKLTMAMTVTFGQVQTQSGKPTPIRLYPQPLPAK